MSVQTVEVQTEKGVRIMRSLAAALAVAIVVCGATDARAKEFSSRKGFSFTYPDDWMVATKELQEEGVRQLKARGQEMPAVDLSAVAVAVFNPVNSGFAPNVNVVVVAGSPRVNENTRQQAVDEGSAALAGAGVSVSNMNSAIIKAAGKDAISVSYDAKYPGQAVLVHAWQVFVPAGSKTFVITCTDTKEHYAEAEPAFKQIVGSFQAASGLPGWLSGGIRGALVAGLIGGLAGGAAWVMRRRKQKPTGG